MHCNGSMLPIVQSFKVVSGQFGLQTVLKPLLTTAEHTTSVLKWNQQKPKKSRNTFKVYKCGSLNSICWLCAYLCQYYWRSVLFWLAGGIDRVHHQSPFCDYDHENRFVIMTMKTNDILTSLGTWVVPIGYASTYQNCCNALFLVFLWEHCIGALKYWTPFFNDQWSMINDHVQNLFFWPFHRPAQQGVLLPCSRGYYWAKYLIFRMLARSRWRTRSDNCLRNF